MSYDDRKKTIDAAESYQDARALIHDMVVAGEIDDAEMEQLIIASYIKYGRYRSFLPEGLQKIF